MNALSGLSTKERAYLLFLLTARSTPPRGQILNWGDPTILVDNIIDQGKLNALLAEIDEGNFLAPLAADIYRFGRGGGSINVVHSESAATVLEAARQRGVRTMVAVSYIHYCVPLRYKVVHTSGRFYISDDGTSGVEISSAMAEAAVEIGCEKINTKPPMS